MSLPVPVPEGIKLPQPSGYRLLIAIRKKEDKIGSIVIPQQFRDREESASIYGCVIEMGPLAYSDPDKFPSGPWCEVGDWVIFRAYSGTRLKIGDQEFRLINDDTVEAVVEDPTIIERAY